MKFKGNCFFTCHTLFHTVIFFIFCWVLTCWLVELLSKVQGGCPCVCCPACVMGVWWLRFWLGRRAKLGCMINGGQSGLISEQRAPVEQPVCLVSVPARVWRAGRWLGKLSLGLNFILVRLTKLFMSESYLLVLSCAGYHCNYRHCCDLVCGPAVIQNVQWRVR